MAFNPSNEKNTQTFAFSLIPKNGLPIDRSTVFDDEGTLSTFVERGWIVDGAKAFIKSKGKTCTIRLDSTATDGFILVEELDEATVNTLATDIASKIVSENAPEKAEVEAIQSVVEGLQGKVDAQAKTLSETSASLQEQVNTVKSIAYDYQIEKENFATKDEVKSEIAHIDLTNYATHDEVTRAKADVLTDVSVNFATTAQLATVIENNDKLRERVVALEAANTSLSTECGNLRSEIIATNKTIEEISKKLLVQPSDFVAAAIIAGAQYEGNASIKYGKQITAVKASWTEGDASIPVTTVRVKIGDATVGEFAAVNGGTYELATAHTITEDVRITVEAVYSIATLRQYINVTMVALQAPKITAVKLTAVDARGKVTTVTGNTSLSAGTTISSGAVSFVAGDSSSYEIDLIGRTLSKNGCVAGQTYTIDGFSGETYTIPETVGQTISITAMVTDKTNATIAPVTKVITLTSADEPVPDVYAGYIDTGTTVEDYELTGTGFQTIAIDGTTSAEFTFSNNAMAGGRKDYMIALPSEYYTLGQVSFFDEGLEKWSTDLSPVKESYQVDKDETMYDIYKVDSNTKDTSKYKFTVVSK